MLHDKIVNLPGYQGRFTFFFTPQSRQPLIRSSGLDRNLTQDVEIQVVILVARGGKEVQGTHEFLLGL